MKNLCVENNMGKAGRPKGYKMSEESKKKTSESMRGNTNNKGKHWT